jgi:hypothetical protein
MPEGVGYLLLKRKFGETPDISDAKICFHFLDYEAAGC